MDNSISGARYHSVTTCATHRNVSVTLLPLVLLLLRRLALLLRRRCVIGSDTRDVPREYRGEAAAILPSPNQNLHPPTTCAPGHSRVPAAAAAR